MLYFFNRIKAKIIEREIKEEKGKDPNITWQRVKQFLFVMSVEMSLVNGLVSAQLVIAGIAFLSKK